jgi:hypothetical protein
VGHGDLDHFKAVLGGQLVHDRVGFLAIGVLKPCIFVIPLFPYTT